jgi:hypothetical protein
MRELILGWSVAIGSGVLAFFFCLVFKCRDIAEKWVTATIGSIATFSFVIYAFRTHLLRWSFWVSLAICLSIHSVLVWIFFCYALKDIRRFSIWLWLPILFAEVFVLLILVKRIVEKFTGKHETMTLQV